MAKIYIPVSDPDNAEIIQEKKTFSPNTVRSFAKLLHTLVPWDVVATFFLYIFQAQLLSLINSRLQKLVDASDEEILSIHERTGA